MGLIEHEDAIRRDPRAAAEHIAHVEAERDRWQDEAQKLRVALDRAQTDRRGAVDLLREIGAMAGAKANGADARAMAKRAREFVTSLDHLGGQ
jgi:hypothetical protein